ncbi:hypothetical protein APHAL10511_000542 [Amanita phalloides]|nr:hypothetical protein APHAL10511_000542 [Amanita phalloides]
MCFQKQQGHSTSGIADNIRDTRHYLSKYEFSVFGSNPALGSSYTGRVPNIVHWARQVSVNDVLLLFSWLDGMATGTYEYVSGPQTPLSFNVEFAFDYGDMAVNQAISRARAQGLCPRRLSSIALNLSGGEFNIPALIPDKSHHNTSCSSEHVYCSTGPSHRNCTFDFCEISTVNFTNVVQHHRPGCDQNCRKKVFPADLLDEVANGNRPTAWAVDGELRPLEPGEPYMAISHVWSDGTGGNGSVHECLYAFFCDIARDLKCKGLWWDAICIPKDKQAHARAINHMHEYYSQAACTVVHDLCLATTEWVDANRASLTLAMSNWYTRGWTALELARSKRVDVLFAARESPGYVRKNLEADILSHAGTVSSLSRLVISTAIRALRGVDEKRSKQQLTVNDVLTSLGPRFTSWARDRAIIAGLFVGIENLADDQHDIYRQIICKIGSISAEQLFHNAASSVGAFAWFPSSLFDLPVSSRTVMLKVTEEGEVVGPWKLVGNRFSSNLPLASMFSWDMVHPLTKCHVRGALSSFDKCVILGECYVNPHTPIARGLVVEVRRIENRAEILCRYVGTVYFRQEIRTELYPMHSIMVRIGGGGLDMIPGINAMEYISNVYRPGHG